MLQYKNIHIQTYYFHKVYCDIIIKTNKVYCDKNVHIYYFYDVI